MPACKECISAEYAIFNNHTKCVVYYRESLTAGNIEYAMQTKNLKMVETLVKCKCPVTEITSMTASSIGCPKMMALVHKAGGPLTADLWTGANKDICKYLAKNNCPKHPPIPVLTAEEEKLWAMLQ